MEEIEHGKQYSLRWEKHAFNLASEAGCFFEDESFLDCTLSAEGQCIDAHKIILSASSSYLSKLLKITPDKHPILIFNDIKFDQLKSLVAFIYNGSVSVSEDNIHAFLKAAQSLLIKGLSEETNDDKSIENAKKHSGMPEVRSHHRKSSSSSKTTSKKSEVHSDIGKPHHNDYPQHKRQRQTAAVTKYDGGCEESLSKLQEISFTKYIHQNLNSKCQDEIRNEIKETKWSGPLMEEKLRGPVENYVVKSWKHKNVEELNGRHRQNHKNNFLSKIKLEKSLVNTNSTSIENNERGNGNRNSMDAVIASGHQTDRAKLEEMEDVIKKEADLEPMMLVEPKQEITEEEDVNSEDYDVVQNASNDSLTSDVDHPSYDLSSLSNYYQTPEVDRGVPVPLLMCRTSLSEPDSVDPNWMPQIAGNGKSDQSNSIDIGKASDLPCRTCTQDLPCPTCTKKYKSRYALNRHILYECGKARKSFSCDECGKKVTRQDTLQKHKLIHLVQHLKKKESEMDEEPPKTKKMC